MSAINIYWFTAIISLNNEMSGKTAYCAVRLPLIPAPNDKDQELRLGPRAQWYSTCLARDKDLDSFIVKTKQKTINTSRAVMYLSDRVLA